VNVAFVIFKRPDCTARVFERIRAARPERLFVIADGARADVPGEAERVAAARAVCEAVDWPCTVDRDYAEANMGCRRRVVSGLNRVFDMVEDAIIIEDDILPDPSFFPFCRELLERYREDERIGSITGFQFLQEMPDVRDSYYFSIYGGIWGWATWRRAWRRYDDDMTEWPELKGRGWHYDVLASSRDARYMERVWDHTHRGDDAWGYRWFFAMRRASFLGIVPRVSLTSNIGFGEAATRTTDASIPGSGVVARSASIPLSHPAEISVGRAFDAQTLEMAREPFPPWWRTFFRAMRCRYTYGVWLRTLPVVGRAWASWRARRSR